MNGAKERHSIGMGGFQIILHTSNNLIQYSYKSGTHCNNNSVTNYGVLV